MEHRNSGFNQHKLIKSPKVEISPPAKQVNLVILTKFYANNHKKLNLNPHHLQKAARCVSAYLKYVFSFNRLQNLRHVGIYFGFIQIPAYFMICQITVGQWLHQLFNALSVQIAKPLFPLFR